MKKREIVLIICICLLLGIIVCIWKTDYEFCWTDGGDSFVCYHQKIGDYLLGKD